VTNRCNRDYIVEVYYNNRFAYHLDAYDTYEEAEKVALDEKRSLDDGYEIQVTVVDYDENDNEIGIYTERL
jgi:hypothetical protein